MVKFEKIPANKQSLSSRRSLFGVGVNDAWYMTGVTGNAGKLTCPVYSRWGAMLKRCYSEKFKSENETYTHCSVCNEWLIFSNFAKWFEDNYSDGYDLDKDIMVKGNKIYSPSTCLFVPKQINSLVQDRQKQRGALPEGVFFHSKNSKYIAQVRIDGKKIHIGSYQCIAEASAAYALAKNKEITRKCEQYPEFAKYLINHLVSSMNK
jgi:hypothetical protein